MWQAIVGRPDCGQGGILEPMATEPRSAFGKRVREIRLKRKLAELADLHRNYAGVPERGRQNPPLLIIVKLARALDVPPSKKLSSVNGVTAMRTMSAAVRARISWAAKE